MNSILGALYRPIAWFRSRSLITKLFLIGGLVIVGLIVIKRSQPNTSNLTIEKVTRGTVSDVVSESGNVEAQSLFQVVSPATGYITHLYVQNGDHVSLGQKLFEVKSTATPEEIAQSLATYLQARAAANNASATALNLRSAMYVKWRRYLDLATNGTYQNSDLSPNTTNRQAAEFQEAQDDWNAAQASYNNQQDIVRGAQAALTAANLAYQATLGRVVTAPVAGLVANLSVREHDRVAAVTATTTPQPVLYVGDFSQDYVKIPLNEVDVNKIKIGQQAQIVFDAMRDKTYQGTVLAVDTVGTNTAGVITYNTVVGIDNADANVKPNMTATATIETSHHDNVLMVPNAAIKPYKGGKAILAPGKDKDGSSKNMLFHFVPITVGLKGVSMTEVTSGVQEGDAVITAGVTTAQLNTSTTSH